MPAIVVLGAQWGDEGKGKATDLLGSSVDYVVKFNGGNNAGHTVVIGDQKYALHLLPSGILTAGCTPVIGNGVVIDLSVLFEELETLDARGIDVSALRVSANAHVIADYNRTIDKVTERFLGGRRLGTTGRGIGPTYADKMNRIGIRVQDLFDEKILTQKVEGVLELKGQVLAKIYNRRAPEVEATVEELLAYAEPLRPMVCDSGLLLNQALDRDETVLLEAGQATLLDVDHGTYPFVTSSSATAGGACTGSGIPPTRIDRVIGIVKAYTTRVGEGPFPTELFDDDGELLRTAGAEFGTTTGRPRRCGWYDAVIARYAARVNGLTEFFLTKLDVLGEWGADPGVRGLPDRRHARRRDADDADGVPPRQADLRVPRRLDVGHLGLPHLRGPAAERAVLRAGARGHVRCSVLGRRCRPRTGTRPSSCAELGLVGGGRLGVRGSRRGHFPRDRGNPPLPYRNTAREGGSSAREVGSPDPAQREHLVAPDRRARCPTPGRRGTTRRPRAPPTARSR
jgi:adenylosuccinate synthase